MKPRLSVRLTGVLLLALSAVRFLPAQEGPEMFQSTLVQDIETAGFYELISWLEVLGLDTRGDRGALANRLYDYYDVAEDERPEDTDESEENPPLVVDSAARTAYFTLEQVDERYIRLSGGVVLTLRDDENNVVHRISADEIVYNQEQEVLSASGNVVYVLEREGTTEQFSGEALSVETDTWEGAFVQGVTERERTIEGEAIDFSFAGDYITRSRDDVIVLENGRITSSEADPPNYEIRARKIWVLAPGEWGLSSAVLYVGRVPVFYFPYFFKPGNELYFNPSFGSEGRSGIYVQTTTYLRGTPAPADTPFSLLQIAEDAGESHSLEREGLYLVPSTGPTRTEPARDDETVKLMFDVYTKLGVFAGIDASWPTIGSFRSASLYAGIAASRNIYAYSYAGQGVTYSPYYITGGEPTQTWNFSSIGSLSIPLRFAFDGHAVYGGDRLNATFDLDLYSDPRFRTDFDSRAEQIDWLGLLGQGSGLPSGGTVSTLQWSVQASYRQPVESLRPTITALNVQNALLALRWRSRTIPDAQLSDAVLDADSSPERQFFYPESMSAPSVSLAVSGTLLDLPHTAEHETENASDADLLIPPWQREDDNTAEDASGGEGDPDVVTPPGTQPALASPSLPEDWTLGVTYNLLPTSTLDLVFADDDWQTPDDIDFGIAHAGFSARGNATVTYRGTMAGGSASFSGSTALSAQYRTVFLRGPEVTDTEWESLQTQAWAYRSVNATNSLSLSVRPLAALEHWRSSSLTYSTSFLIYRLVYDGIGGDSQPEYRSETIEWDPGFIRTHEIQARAIYDAGQSQSLQFAASLPPRDPRYSTRIGVNVGPLNVTASTGVTNVSGAAWTWDPVASTQSLTLGTIGLLSNQLSYDLMAAELAFDRTALTAGPFTSNVELRTSERFALVPTLGWQPAGDRAVRVTRATAALALHPDIEPMWRNRIVTDLNISTSVTANLLRFTESLFNITFSTTVAVYRFVTVSLRATSTNDQIYVYIPALADQVGREWRNPLVDLARSFNFFSRSDRTWSAFNLRQIEFNLQHELGDWDLTVSYGGAPTLTDLENGSKAYKWRGTLNLNLEWRPIRELRTEITADPDDITFGSDS